MHRSPRPLVVGGPPVGRRLVVPGIDPALGRIDGLEYLFRVHLGRQRELHQDTVDFVPRVQAGHQVQEVLGRRRRGAFDPFTVEAKRLAGFHFIADVNLRSRILAHQHRREARRDPRRLQFSKLVAEFSLDLVPDFAAVKNARAQPASTYVMQPNEFSIAARSGSRPAFGRLRIRLVIQSHAKGAFAL